MQKVENEKGYSITYIRNYHGGEFDNDDYENFCKNKGYTHNFSAPKMPQQNSVVEKKNHILQEMARTMINENSLLKYF